MKSRLEQLRKSTGKIPDALKPKFFPYALLKVWDTFCNLSNSRGAGMSGPLPISYQDIKAYQELTKVILSPRDIATIKKLDNVYLGVLNG